MVTWPACGCVVDWVYLACPEVRMAEVIGCFSVKGELKGKFELSGSVAGAGIKEDWGCGCFQVGDKIRTFEGVD